MPAADATRAERGRSWTLHRRDDGRLLARLVVTFLDFPWLNARVAAGDGFAEVRPLFDTELRLLYDAEDQVDSWERAYHALRAAVALRCPDGQDIPEFLLHIEGDEAWWRWSDKPFDDDTGV